MRRIALPTVSRSGQQALDAHEQVLRNEEDLAAVTIAATSVTCASSLPGAN